MCRTAGGNRKPGFESALRTLLPSAHSTREEQWKPFGRFSNWLAKEKYQNMIEAWEDSPERGKSKNAFYVLSCWTVKAQHSVEFMEGPGISLSRSKDSDSCKMFHIQLDASYSLDRSSCSLCNVFINMKWALLFKGLNKEGRLDHAWLLIAIIPSASEVPPLVAVLVLKAAKTSPLSYVWNRQRRRWLIENWFWIQFFLKQHRQFFFKWLCIL